MCVWSVPDNNTITPPLQLTIITHHGRQTQTMEIDTFPAEKKNEAKWIESGSALTRSCTGAHKWPINTMSPLFLYAAPFWCSLKVVIVQQSIVYAHLLLIVCRYRPDTSIRSCWFLHRLVASCISTFRLPTIHNFAPYKRFRTNPVRKSAVCSASFGERVLEN